MGTIYNKLLRTTALKRPVLVLHPRNGNTNQKPSSSSEDAFEADVSSSTGLNTKHYFSPYLRIVSGYAQGQDTRS